MLNFPYMKKYILFGVCCAFPFLLLRLIFPDVSHAELVHESVTAVFYIFASYASYYVLTRA